MNNLSLKISKIVLVAGILASFFCCSELVNNDPDNSLELLDSIAKIDTSYNDSTLTYFSAYINDSFWEADSVYNLFYEDQLFLIGSDSLYTIQIIDTDLTDTISFHSFQLQILDSAGGLGISTSPKIAIEAIDLDEGYISADFEFNCEIRISGSNTGRIFQIKNGKINRLHFDPLYCEREFEIGSEAVDSFGTWQLSKIIDGKTNEIFFPPCNSNITLTFDDGLISNSFQPDYEKNISIRSCNDYFTEYSRLNDSVFVTSQGGQTLSLCNFHYDDFDNFLFSLINEDTLCSNWNYNTMRITNSREFSLFSTNNAT